MTPWRHLSGLLTTSDELDAELGTVLGLVIDSEPTGDPVRQYPGTNSTDGLPFEAEYGTDDDSAAIISPVWGDLLEINWPHGNLCSGRVCFITPSGEHVIMYDDSGTEPVNL